MRVESSRFMILTPREAVRDTTVHRTRSPQPSPCALHVANCPPQPLRDCRPCAASAASSASGIGAPTSRRCARMSERLVHRGPDDDGLFAEGPVALAARRLSIIDLDGGDQPIANEDGSVVVVQNGEIYNYRELRGELERAGHRFATDCDTEVLVHLYEEHGRGVRRAAAGDVRDRALGRGASGACCWPATASGSSRSTTASPAATLSFASELKAMLEQPGFSREIDPRAVAAYLAFNSIPAPLTIFAEARKLPAGHLLTWRGRRGRALRRYARPAPAAAGEARARPGGGARRGAARGACATRSAPTSSPTCRSACCSPAASTRPASRRSPPPSSGEPVQDLLDRLRGGGLRRARRGRGWSPSATAPTTTSSSCAPTRSSCCRSWSRPSTSRSATPRRCRPTSSPSSRRARSRSPSPARAATSCSAATTPTSPTCWRRASAGSRRSPRRWSRRCRAPPPGQLRLQSQALRPRRRACRRWSATTPGRRSSRPPARAELLGTGASAWDPLDLYRERYAETEGRRAAGAAAGRRPRHLPGRRPAGQDRPLEHGPLAGAARALPRPGGRRVRPRAADAAEGARPRQEAAAAPGARAAAAAARSCAAASRASRSRSPPGCAARSSRSPARCCRRRRSRARAASTPPPSPRCSTATCSGREDLSRQLWGLMAFTLWFERYAMLAGVTTAIAANLATQLSISPMDCPLGARLAWWPLDRAARRCRVGAIDYPTRARCTRSRRRSSAASAILAGVLVAGLIWLPWDSETRAILIGAVRDRRRRRARRRLRPRPPRRSCSGRRRGGDPGLGRGHGRKLHLPLPRPPRPRLGRPR